MSICKRKRIKNPNGTWGYDSMIGAKVRIRSTAITNFFGTYCASDVYEIVDIYFQISLDGKCITIIELDGLKGKFFTWKDLEVIEVSDGGDIIDATCGIFNSGQSIVGRNVSHEPTWLEDIGTNGLALIDDKGNIITGRYIRIPQADIEDITTDIDNVTDITFNGKVL